jgi:hypothetical protein
MVSDEQFKYLMILGVAIVASFFFFRFAVRADKQVNQQRAMIDLLEELCKKQGVPPDTIDGIKNARGLE